MLRRTAPEAPHVPRISAPRRGGTCSLRSRLKQALGIGLVPAARKEPQYPWQQRDENESGNSKTSSRRDYSFDKPDGGRDGRGPNNEHARDPESQRRQGEDTNAKPYAECRFSKRIRSFGPRGSVGWLPILTALVRRQLLNLLGKRPRPGARRDILTHPVSPQGSNCRATTCSMTTSNCCLIHSSGISTRPWEVALSHGPSGLRVNFVRSLVGRCP